MEKKKKEKNGDEAEFVQCSFNLIPYDAKLECEMAIGEVMDT